MKTLEEWQTAAEAIEPPVRAFINGEPVDVAATYPDINPATGELIAEVASGDDE